MGHTASTRVTWALIVSAAAVATGTEPPLDFNRDIRPLLSD